MSKRKKDLIIIFVIGLILFYVLPLIATLLPAVTGLWGLIGLLVMINPTYGFIASVIYTKRNGFKADIPVMIGVLFLPAVYLFYNSTALIYVVIYVVTSLIGSGISYTMYNRG